MGHFFSFTRYGYMTQSHNHVDNWLYFMIMESKRVKQLYVFKITFKKLEFEDV